MPFLSPHPPIRLQLVGKVNSLVIDSQLLAVILDDENPNGARSTAEGLLDAVVQAALIDHLETLLDLAGFGHGHQPSIVTDVDEAVLLEDGAEERVEHD